jgi:hypothetical protein
MVARRDGIDYVHCLDCNQVYEAEDLEPVLVYDEDQALTPKPAAVR